MGSGGVFAVALVDVLISRLAHAVSVDALTCKRKIIRIAAPSEAPVSADVHCVEVYPLAGVAYGVDIRNVVARDIKVLLSDLKGTLLCLKS